MITALLAKDMRPPNPSPLLLEMVELGELLRESPSPSDSPGSLRLLGRRGRCGLARPITHHSMIKEAEAKGQEIHFMFEFRTNFEE